MIVWLQTESPRPSECSGFWEQVLFCKCVNVKGIWFQFDVGILPVAPGHSGQTMLSSCSCHGRFYPGKFPGDASLIIKADSCRIAQTAASAHAAVAVPNETCGVVRRLDAHSWGDVHYLKSQFYLQGPMRVQLAICKGARCQGIWDIQSLQLHGTANQPRPQHKSVRQKQKN